MTVSMEPSGMFIFTFPFTAQPLASRIGAMFLCFSFAHAMNIDGTEIISINPTIPSGIHQPSPRNACSKPPTTVAIPVKATLMAAIVPTSIFLPAVASFAAVAASVGFSTAADIFSATDDSAEAAVFAMRS